MAECQWSRAVGSRVLGLLACSTISALFNTLRCLVIGTEHWRMSSSCSALSYDNWPLPLYSYVFTCMSVLSVFLYKFQYFRFQIKLFLCTALNWFLCRVGNMDLILFFCRWISIFCQHHLLNRLSFYHCVFDTFKKNMFTVLCGVYF